MSPISFLADSVRNKTNKINNQQFSIVALTTRLTQTHEKMFNIESEIGYSIVGLQKPAEVVADKLATQCRRIEQASTDRGIEIATGCRLNIENLTDEHVIVSADLSGIGPIEEIKSFLEASTLENIALTQFHIEDSNAAGDENDRRLHIRFVAIARREAPVQ